MQGGAEEEEEDQRGGQEREGGAVVSAVVGGRLCLGCGFGVLATAMGEKDVGEEGEGGEQTEAGKCCGGDLEVSGNVD